MAVTYIDVQNLPGGEFAATSEADINFMMDLARFLVDEGYYGDSYDKALLLATAHLLKDGGDGLNTGGFPTGPVTSRTAGPFNQTFGQMSMASFQSRWDTTSYGRMLYALMRSRRWYIPIIRP